MACEQQLCPLLNLINTLVTFLTPTFDSPFLSVILILFLSLSTLNQSF